MMRSFWARTESRSACRPRSASNSSTSRYDKEKRRYQPTARRMTSGSNCLHLNRPETDDARSIGPAYQTTTAKLNTAGFTVSIIGVFNWPDQLMELLFELFMCQLIFRGQVRISDEKVP